jgi:hypothetical protein
MHSTPRRIAFDDGQNVWMREADHTVVGHWATKHSAQLLVERVRESGAISHFVESAIDRPIAINGTIPKYIETHNVWVVPSSKLGAYYEATLIESLLSAVSAQDCKRLRRTLSQAGYPDSVLDTVPEPK